MNAIITKFHPATSKRGSRISATDNDGNRVIIDNPNDVSWVDGMNHAQAAIALCKKVGWHGKLLRWMVKPGSWVFIPEWGDRITIPLDYRKPKV